MGSFAPPPRTQASSVCIIGAGPSGLAAAKYLSAENAFSRIDILEQRSTVGGVWNYVPAPTGSPHDLAVPQTNPNAGVDEPVWRHSNADAMLGDEAKKEAAFMSPLYDQLETNIPRGLMGFSDLKWDEACQLFPPHAEVLAYIERYAEDVRYLISFERQVLDVRLNAEERWVVKSTNLQAEGKAEAVQETYDAVIVANGHFNIPYVPSVPGMEVWQRDRPGTITHSKFYRHPAHYRNQKVVIVGNSASGLDIAAQIAQHCALPLIQSRKSASYLQTEPLPNTVEKPEIIGFTPQGRTVHFADGTAEPGIDAVIYCTGYFYSFPFMPALDPPLVSTGERVENLYQHMFYRPHPTLAFPVLNQKVIPFPMAEVQGAVIARVLAGRLGLPSGEAMEAWERAELEEKGAGREFHLLKFPKDAEYLNMLHRWAMSAGEGGKTPPFWGEKEFWMRERFPAIKKAFQRCGEGRKGVRRLEDVGFDFEEWKRERGEEGKRLL